LREKGTMNTDACAKRRRKLYRWVLPTLLLISVVLAFTVRPAFLWSRAWLHDQPVFEELGAGEVDDASRMNRASVVAVWPTPRDPAIAEAELRELLARARREKSHVSIAGARHSMGGHTIYPGGIVLDMLPFDAMELDEAAKIIRVGAGARWSAIVPYLDAHGLSVGVMQSNDNFTVGGSISVNCHGWQHDRPPIVSTVKGFRMMQADGTTIRCSREEHAELFSLAIGGYGLFGVILDVDLDVVPNERYAPEAQRLPAEEYPERFSQDVGDAKDIGMVYGRLCVVPGDDVFLREAVIVAFRRVDVLLEYFVPAHGFAPFLEAAREIIPRHEADLLNVTIRTIRADPDSFLRYADQDMFSLVMLFNHERTTVADERMRGMTQELIDAAIRCDGRFYLPYRLHATAKQLRAAYPQIDAFFDRKRHYDPEQVFQNQFYTTYATP
jgi:FAD/FMN-containing dehydrogenase